MIGKRNDSQQTVAAIFDLDGTLIDSAPQIAEAGDAMLRARGAAPLTLAEARDFIGHGADAFIARALAARGLAPDGRARDDFMAAYQISSAGPQTVYPQARETLEALAARGVGLGLCTNKPRGPTDAALRAAGLAGVFGCEVAGGEHGHKPDPAPLLACARSLGARVEACVMIGDSEADAEAARTAGMRFALRRGGYLKIAPEKTGATFIFDAFGELADWLLSYP